MLLFRSLVVLEQVRKTAFSAFLMLEANRNSHVLQKVDILRTFENILGKIFGLYQFLLKTVEIVLHFVTACKKYNIRFFSVLKIYSTWDSAFRIAITQWGFLRKDQRVHLFWK